MASPQIENGYIRIANEIWDEVIRRDFSKRQKSIIFLIWRVSYGCQKRTAYIPNLTYFELAGVRKNHIKEELIQLEQWSVIRWDREAKIFEFNKNYEEWELLPLGSWEEQKFKELMALNLFDSSQNGNLKFLKQEPEVPKPGTMSTQNGNSEFLEQELTVPETGTFGSQNRNSKFPKQELSEGHESAKFPKQEPESSQNGNSRVPETGTAIASYPLCGPASEARKDIIKDNINKSSSTKILSSVRVTETSGSRGGSEEFSFSRIYQAYEANFTRDGRVTEFEIDEIQILFDDYGGGWVFQAMKEAILHNVKTLAYVHGVLKGYKQRGGPEKQQAPPAESRAAPGIYVLDEDDPITKRLREADKQYAQYGTS